MLSFNLIRTEAMFMKLYTIKIADGHHLVKNLPENSVINPFIDQSNTNLSIFSNNCEFPIYNKKSFSIERKVGIPQPKFIISSNLNSDYRRNVYFIMLMKEDVNSNFLNLNDFPDTKNNSLVPFSYFTDTPNGSVASEKKKILQVVQPNKEEMTKIAISIENCYSVLVLEFEVHDNADLDFKNQLSFVDENPLFLKKGIRLINAVDFKTRLT